MRGVSLDWFKSYLLNRKLCVEFNSCISSSFDVKFGCPQGSVLGPILYNYFTNDLRKQLRYCQCICFADDTTIFLRESSLKFIKHKLKQDIKEIMTYFKQHTLTLNLDKTNLMDFGKNMVDDIEFTLNDIRIKQCNSVRFLGVQIDNRLNWNEHANHVINKISSGIRSLKCAKQLIPNYVRRSIYFANVQSYIQYALTSWGLMVKQNMQTAHKLL